MKDVWLDDRCIEVAVIRVVGGSCRARAWGFVDLEAGGGRHGEVCRRCHASDRAIMVLASRARPDCHREQQEQAG